MARNIKKVVRSITLDSIRLIEKKGIYFVSILVIQGVYVRDVSGDSYAVMQEPSPDSPPTFDSNGSALT